MTVPIIAITLPGLDPLVRGLSRMRVDIDDWRPFWTKYFAPFFYRMVQQDFLLEGGGSGASWAPLSPAYQQWKSARGFGNRILVRSGALKASLSGPAAAGAIFHANADSLEVGTSVPYALFHQLGTARRGAASGMRAFRGYAYGAGRGMPARPPMRLSPAFMDVLAKSMQQYIQGIWNTQVAGAKAAVAGNYFGVGGL